MSKPRHTLYRRCEYEGCGDTGIVECSSAKERLSELAKPYRCAKHAEPSRLLTTKDRTKRMVLIAQRACWDANNSKGLFWGEQSGHLGSGYVFGPGFCADANDFPIGTRLVVTATIEEPI